MWHILWFHERLNLWFHAEKKNTHGWRLKWRKIYGTLVAWYEQEKAKNQMLTNTSRTTTHKHLSNSLKAQWVEPPFELGSTTSKRPRRHDSKHPLQLWFRFGFEGERRVAAVSFVCVFLGFSNVSWVIKNKEIRFLINRDMVMRKKERNQDHYGICFIDAVTWTYLVQHIYLSWS